MGWGRRISQVALAPSPLCPRSLPRETDCIQTRGANCSRGARVQEPNYGHGALLCARTATGHAVTEQADELASLHSITSSARASSVAGTVMPSALAVFILMTSWKRVGCSTGKSAGWAPLRILSTYTAALRKRSAYIAEYDISPPWSANQRGTETAGTRCCSASSAARLLGRLG